MFMYVFSILLIVASNVVYHISQKSTPAQANPFASLLVTYAVAAAVTVAALLVTTPSRAILPSFRDVNWTSLALGVSVVGLEFGFLAAYRSGWNINVGSLVANTILAVALIPVGMLLYREGFGPAKLAGAALCVVGLVLINRP